MRHVRCGESRLAFLPWPITGSMVQFSFGIAAGFFFFSVAHTMHTCRGLCVFFIKEISILSQDTRQFVG